MKPRNKTRAKIDPKILKALGLEGLVPGKKAKMRSKKNYAPWVETIKKPRGGWVAILHCAAEAEGKTKAEAIKKIRKICPLTRYGSGQNPFELRCKIPAHLADTEPLYVECEQRKRGKNK